MSNLTSETTRKDSDSLTHRHTQYACMNNICVCGCVCVWLCIYVYVHDLTLLADKQLTFLWAGEPREYYNDTSWNSYWKSDATDSIIIIIVI